MAIAKQSTAERKAYRAAWFQKNRDRLIAKFRDKYQSNRVEITKARRAAYAAKAAEERSALAKEYRAAHRDQINERERLYRLKHPEVFRKIKKRAKERIRSYRLANMDRFRMYVRNRRAMQAGAEGSYTLQEWLNLVDVHGGRCVYCGSRERMTVDHKIPLARGGSNFIDNIVPACLSCNSRKNTKTDAEWLAVNAVSSVQI